MAFDFIHCFDLCVKCKKVATVGQQNYIDPNKIEQGTRLAILSLSKKTLCLSCHNQIMLEAFKKGDDSNVSETKLPVRTDSGDTGREGSSQNQPVSNVWDLL